MAKQSENQNAKRQIRIEIGDDVADGTYANLAFISNNNSEFILDFARFLPGNTRGKVASRVVLTPIHAKAFLKSLADSVEKYEKKFGQITVDHSDKNIGFQINAGDAKKD
ncbi:DUF3467 domain-containing protein [Candidatus Latescibacterota bacterium]